MKKVFYYLLPFMLLSCRDQSEPTATIAETKAKPSAKADDILNRIKTHTIQNVSYNYVDDLVPDVNEAFFEGTKSFKGFINDVYKVDINANNISIYDMNNAGKIVLKGHLQKGSIIDGSGRTVRFIYRKDHLYYNGDANEWYVFNELKEL